MLGVRGLDISEGFLSGCQEQQHVQPCLRLHRSLLSLTGFLLTLFSVASMESAARISQKSCVKIYLCTNPEDSELERRVLRESVFPRLRDHCLRAHRVDFRVSLHISITLKTPKHLYSGTISAGSSSAQFTHDIPQAGEERDEREVAYEDVGAILQTVVTRCVQEGILTSEKARKYFTSALESELRFALEDHPLEDVERCFCYVHKFADMNDQGEATGEAGLGLVSDSPEQASLNNPLIYLREQLLPSLAAPQQILIYTSSPDEEDTEARKQYIEVLCQQLHTDLRDIINRTLVRDQAHANDPLVQDLLQQWDLCSIYSRLYKVESPEVQDVKSYLEQSDTKYPLIISGRPCVGKTVLLAHCATQVKTWMDGKHPLVVVYFVRGDHGTLKELLISVCHQITAGCLDQPHLQAFQSLSQLVEYFTDLLIRISTSKRPLILILDGLDQMGHEEDGSCNLTWLPQSLLPNVKLLISTTPKKSATLQTLMALYSKSSLFLELGLKQKRKLTQMLTDLLFACNRRITSGQQLYVGQALEHCPLMMYVELLHRQVCEWGSETEVTEHSITTGVHNNIGIFLGRLENKHGTELVSRAMCYLTVSRLGLTEAELTDVLSADNRVLSQYLPCGETPPCKFRVPETAVESLLIDLRGFLLRRYVAGCKVLFWASRHFPLVVNKLYMSSDEITQDVHTVLADYFSGRWAYGRAKSLIVSRDTIEQSNSQPAPQIIPEKVYIDRLHPGQPWLIESPLSRIVQVNLRKILELLFQMKAGGRLEELGRTVMSFGFHEAMLKAGRLEELVSELQDASLLVFHQELRLLASIFKDSACLLQDCPEDLPMVIQAKLLPFLDIVPSLECYIKQVFEEGRKNNSLSVVHSSVTTVPSTRWMLSDVDPSPVVQVLDVQCNTLLIILQNGSLWAWKEHIPGGFQHIHLSNLEFSGGKSAQDFLLLSTRCGKLFLCHFPGPSCICEVNSESSLPDSQTGRGTRLQVEGFFVLDSMMFVWYKDTSHVSMFDVNTGAGLPPLCCQSRVTCMSCSPNDLLILCGQDEGKVLLFDVQSKHQLSTCSNPEGGSVISTYFHNENELVCVDSFGSVFVWDMKTTSDPKLKKSCCFTEDQDDVLNTEHSHENRALVICKKHQVWLWDTSDWTMEEQFSVPAGKTFTQATLVKGGHLIIASLEDCPFLLVWKTTTGQCVLSLDVGGTQVAKFLKQESTLLAITANGVLTAWGLDLIWRASAISRTGMKVKKIHLEPTGGHFYTADGTELVWRWDMLSGRAGSCFEHEGRVKTFALSPDCEHLVSASAADIYVWRIDTGQNLHRIRNSNPVSNLLITPNSNFAVSLCQRGLSRVWKLTSGHIVCSIHLHLRNAAISAESTFLLGLHKHDLLAISLWSGCTNKKFFCSSKLVVVAFQPLLHHPEYVLVLSSSGYLFTWKVTEETIFQHVQVPHTLLDQPELFQFSSDGKYVVLSTTGMTINILDTQNGRLCLIEAETPLLLVSMDVAGRYIAYICVPEPNECVCDLHSKPTLFVAHMSNGKKVGRLRLGSFPSTLRLSEELCVYVGFQDGSVGIYAISDMPDSSDIIRRRLRDLGQATQCPYEEPQVWEPLTAHTITFMDPGSKVV
ncbi:NACHT and WD repeat domain-containing protein 2 isoform X2 [Brienomyrus brachyistius]|uniref:NACHT and WD repeat domain-containing protein 2 isoform X2 n=1 Tax=Brienomyrus brachyistius TaxID=42636 RepID=UPI0020B26BE5|nr:NACHT and WD repeat domain-containing protein 2 isoform X2 [Brienomyrus brachyistius]